MCERSRKDITGAKKGDALDGIYFVKTGLDLDQKEKISDLIEVAFTFCDMNGADFGRSVTFKNRFNEQIS